jgi:hypothetical protein
MLFFFFSFLVVKKDKGAKLRLAGSMKRLVEIVERDDGSGFLRPSNRSVPIKVYQASISLSPLKIL